MAPEVKTKTENHYMKHFFFDKLNTSKISCIEQTSLSGSLYKGISSFSLQPYPSPANTSVWYNDLLIFILYFFVVFCVFLTCKNVYLFSCLWSDIGLHSIDGWWFNLTIIYVETSFSKPESIFASFAITFIRWTSELFIHYLIVI